jgi:hypothetical protein
VNWEASSIGACSSSFGGIWLSTDSAGCAGIEASTDLVSSTVTVAAASAGAGRLSSTD